MAVINLLKLNSDEKVTGFEAIEDFEADKYLLFGTKSGQVKKTALNRYLNIHKGGLIAVSLRENDHLIGVELTDDEHDVILVTKNGKGIRFCEKDIRPTGRNTSGVRGINLDKDDEVIAMVVPDESANLLIVTENGFGKATNIDDFRVQNRGGKGLIAYKTTKKTGKAIGALLLDPDESNDMLLINDAGIIIGLTLLRFLYYHVILRCDLMRSRDAKVVDVCIIDEAELKKILNNTIFNKRLIQTKTNDDLDHNLEIDEEITEEDLEIT